MSPICPECAAGKHVNCTLETIDDNDEMVACACDKCHPPRVPHNVFVVYDSGSIEELFNVTADQAAQFLEHHPNVHIFEGVVSDVPDQED